MSSVVARSREFDGRTSKTYESIIRAKLKKRSADEIGDKIVSLANSDDNLSQHEMVRDMPPLPQVHKPTEVSQKNNSSGISFSPIINCCG